MLQSYNFLSWLFLADESLGGGSATNGVTIIRVGLFMTFLAFFVFTCGMAWRTLPFLRKLLPATFLNPVDTKQTSNPALLAEKGPDVDVEAILPNNRPGQLVINNVQASRREWLIFISLSLVVLLNIVALVFSYAFLN